MSKKSSFVFYSVPIADFYSMEEVGQLLHLTKSTVYELAKKEEDPLPARMIGGKKRGAIIARDELIEWVKRNARLIAQIKNRS